MKKKMMMKTFKEIFQRILDENSTNHVKFYLVRCAEKTDYKLFLKSEIIILTQYDFNWCLKNDDDLNEGFYVTLSFGSHTYEKIEFEIEDDENQVYIESTAGDWYYVFVNKEEAEKYYEENKL